MPGRQAHGRPLLPTAGSSGGGGGGPKKSRSKSKPAGFSRAKATAKALDAFAIAAEQIPTSNKGVRTRDLDPEPSERSGAKNKRRHQDEDDEDDEDMDDEDEDEDLDGPPRKKTRPTRDDDDDFGGFSGGSDSEGNEWHTGVAGDDEDSDIDSDEAFGESDEERFEGFAFRGSASNKKKPKKPKKKQPNGSDDDSEEEEEEEDDDEDLESLGSDAIDLATALDQYESDDDQPEGGQDSGSGSEEEDDEDEDSEESESDEDEDEDVDDPSKLSALQNIIAGFGGDDDEEKGDGQKKSNKLSLSDLGLAGLVKDPHIKKSLKLMNKEEKADKAGAAKKLDVPLPRRQQEQLLRSAAYEKTSETLDRWIDTVKHNRRADHLVFPLAQNAQNWGLDQTELAPVTQKTAGTELEQTILAIMEESGLGPSAEPEKKEGEEDAVGADGQKLSAAELKEMQRQRRRERELHSREAARAKRIKKIKSKAYRRIHRKELLKEEQAEHGALAEAGELDSDEEREALDRRRALERMGVRHKESKWAKLGKKAGRAVWDDDFRAGLTDITRRKEELRRRIEGRKNADGGSDDDDDDDDDEGSFASGDDEEVDKRRLLKELEKAAAYDDDEPQSALMKMKFMQRGEAQRKKENDDAVKDLHRQLDSDAEEELDSAEEAEVGRRQYGMGKLTANNPFAPKKSKGKAAADAEEEEEGRSVIANLNAALAGRSEQLVAAASAEPGAGNAWSRSTGEDGGKKNKKAKASSKTVEVVASAGIEMEMARPEPKAKPAKKSQVAVGEQDDNDNDDDADMHLPMAIRDQELLDQAFGGDYVVEEFEKEKAAVQVEDDDKEVDETLPGWGSWVGDGVSNKEKKRHTGRFVTKVEGIKKKDRRDFKLKGVIISEKRVKKNDKYLASQLPHPFESQAQYERSLRLPVGPEWVTKETFQDVTKPRVILKQGIITPMSKPMF
ncbi:Utp14 protein-domain-containing protein [Diplogelasinospora grovesii]|uniref:Utp14 protein-domain-containing protein n=1 Tax=Diplogelasinospora grovesii TaxID=303347 RepID=A0AAN6NCC7_9PEZI|nr:Utp14 protein-domain-containing protein [Diplogelasinospora grovesii]